MNNRTKKILTGFLTFLLLVITVICFWTVLRMLKPDPGSSARAYENSESTGSGFFTDSEQSQEIQKTGETEETGAVLEVTPKSASTEELMKQKIQNLLSSMTTEEKVAQLFIITPDALTGGSGVTAAEESARTAFETYPVGGIVYFENNLASPEQIRTMNQNFQSISQNRLNLPLFLTVDEEGGTVTRLASNQQIAQAPDYPITDVGNMCDIGASGDPSLSYEAGLTLGGYLSHYGFNVDYAPDADVLVNPENTVVKYRSFGRDPQMVSQMVTAQIEGFAQTGVLTALKHFPGHGATSEDSHEGFAYSDRTLDELKSCELLPFQAGIEAGCSFVMVGHISLPSVTGDVPASLSEELVTGLLKEEMHFEGIAVTDAMNMGAISGNYSSSEAAVAAIRAGIDMLLMPADFHSAYEGVLQAVSDGTISQERLNDALTRILQVKLKQLQSET